MRILHLRASNFYGGPERQIHLHAKAALGSRFEITVASFTENGAPPGFLQVISADGVETHAFAVRSAYDRSGMRLLSDYIVEREIDILCTHDYRTTILGWFASRRLKKQWLAFSRGFTTTNLKLRAYQCLERRLMRRARHVIAVSQAQKDKLIPYRVPEDRITVARNAIDVDRLSAVPSIDLRSRFGFDPDTILCVAAGRFSQEKGQLVLVRAAADAMRAEPNLRFVLFGDGPDRPQIQNIIEDFGLRGYVICPGFERNIPGCLGDADILVNPSWSEGLPNIVLEAMALSVPVVATAVGGVPEIIQDDKTGCLVPAGRHDLMSQSLLRLAAEPTTRNRLGRTALDFVRSECTFERQFAIIAAVYDTLV